ncbi:hypothetical protein [Arcobacter roscoffensis]|uniref:Uncharacterized protein n=1 Tax=Arcobacter roscoffensis TaxID=2961520 RepID=A0ABY5DZ74_9BACT|nr:hypothetical protein [Arcobacter roscoffensis]UTJ05237.1 hypothetical protein NJU99_08120 [Arcobacter roscoffensis]
MNDLNKIFVNSNIKNNIQNLKANIDLIKILLDNKDIVPIDYINSLKRLESIYSCINTYIINVNPELTISSKLKSNLENINTYILESTKTLNIKDENITLKSLEDANINLEECLKIFYLNFFDKYIDIENKREILEAYNDIIKDTPEKKSLYTEIKDAKTNIDNIYKESSDVKSDINTLHDIVIKDAETIALKKNDIIENHEAINEINNDLAQIYDVISIDEENKDSIYTKIKEINKRVEDFHYEVSKAYEEILVDKEEKTSYKTSIITAKEEIEKFKKETNELVESIEEETIKINSFFDKIFGKENDDGTRKGGLSNKIDTLIENFEKYKNEQEIYNKDINNKREDTYNTLKDKIEDLIEGATSAGLAKSYSEKRKEYQNGINSWNYLFIILVFTIPIIAYFSIYILNKDTDLTISFLKTLPLVSPIVWFAWYASKRRNEYHVLMQEYAHKEAFTMSYSSFKKQLNELGEKDEELMKQLLKKSLEITSRNPVDFFEKGHNSPAEETYAKINNK